MRGEGPRDERQDGYRRSAINAGCVDFDLSVEVFWSMSRRKTIAIDGRLKGVGREETNEKGARAVRAPGTTPTPALRAPRARGWRQARA